MAQLIEKSVGCVLFLYAFSCLSFLLKVFYIHRPRLINSSIFRSKDV